MGEITVTIDGRQVTGTKGMTILDIARAHGIYIPTLCYHRDLFPSGNCRVCVVEVEGSRPLVGACHTPATQGMVIETDSPRVQEARKAIIELLLASHSGTCYMCDKANICELRQIAAEADVGLPRFKTRRRFYQKEDASPYVVRDLTKCVLCRRCVRACAEIKKSGILGIGYRGFESKIVAGCDEPIDGEVCRDCNVCVDICPTGALMKKPAAGDKAGKRKPLVVRG